VAASIVRGPPAGCSKVRVVTKEIQMLAHRNNGHCRSCGSKSVSRSKRRGIVERVLFRLLPIRPYRCNDCDSRFYGYHKKLSYL